MRFLAGQLDGLVYGGDAWTVCERRAGSTAPSNSGDSVFCIGNGFIGIRGFFDETSQGSDRRSPIVHLNGVYEKTPIHYHEAGHGFASSSDTRIPVADGTQLQIFVGGEKISEATGSYLERVRELDLQAGVLRYTATWRSHADQTLRIHIERAALFERRELAIQKIILTPEDFSGEITARVTLNSPSIYYDVEENGLSKGPYDPRIGPILKTTPWQAMPRERGDPLLSFAHRTKNSRFFVFSALETTAASPSLINTRDERSEKACVRTMTFHAGQANPIEIDCCLAYGAQQGGETSQGRASVKNALAHASASGAAALLSGQARYLEAFWANAGVAMPTAPDLLRALRFGMFQLLQAAGSDGRTSVSAKGQTGEGYEGHIFWDAEIFALPFFVFNKPEIARSMLAYRYSGLAAARRNAQVLGHARGALYPWRTIAGEECSSYFPAGSAQYHINADIAYAIRQYVEATGDQAFLVSHGAEMIVETARIWLEIGYFDPGRKGAFSINEVTGPDEYSALVNNNLYTNVMAKSHLEYAVEVLELLRNAYREDFERLWTGLQLSNDEVAQWRRAAQKMLKPYDEERKLYLQDDAFLHRKPWPAAEIPKDKLPLLMHFHPLAIYRRQVCKQADAVLAMHLLKEQFSKQDVNRALDFYEKVTVHDSTLSPCVFGAVAARCGDLRKAYDYFVQTALIDLEDVCRNTGYGLHMAAMGGAWICLAMGFGGMRVTGGKLTFEPKYSDKIGEYGFKTQFKGRLLHITVRKSGVEYSLLKGETINFQHGDVEVNLLADATTVLAVAGLDDAIQSKKSANA